MHLLYDRIVISTGYSMKKRKSQNRRRGKADSSEQMTVAEPSQLVSGPRELYEGGPGFYQRAKSARVSVTVDSSLLALVDDYVARQANTNRSMEFDRALEMWARWWQETCDNNCYRNMSELEKKERKDWTAITTEAAKYIWP